MIEHVNLLNSGISYQKGNINPYVQDVQNCCYIKKSSQWGHYNNLLRRKDDATQEKLFNC